MKFCETWNDKFPPSVRTRCQERHRCQSPQEAGSSTWRQVACLLPAVQYPTEKSDINDQLTDYSLKNGVINFWS